MAHAGGFISGSLMMAVAYYLNPKMMNEEYIEENQGTPQLQLDLNKVYGNISKSRLTTALHELDKISALKCLI
jgi:hypothetical protein